MCAAAFLAHGSEGGRKGEGRGGVEKREGRCVCVRERNRMKGTRERVFVEMPQRRWVIAEAVTEWRRLPLCTTQDMQEKTGQEEHMPPTSLIEDSSGSLHSLEKNGWRTLRNILFSHQNWLLVYFKIPKDLSNRQTDRHTLHRHTLNPCMCVYYVHTYIEINFKCRFLSLRKMQSCNVTELQCLRWLEENAIDSHFFKPSSKCMFWCT